MNLRIGNNVIENGKKERLMLPVADSALELPVTVINGIGAGPTVLVSAGVHGAEYIGIQTVMELSRELEPETVNGQLIFLLLANPPACHQFARFVVPADGKNLNRGFPGKKDGSLSEQIAYTMVHELQSEADYYIDIHAGDTSERVMPFAYFAGSAKEEVAEASRRMAMAADMSIRARSLATTGAYSCAGVHGIPAVLLERGGGGVYTREEVELYKQDVRNIFIHLGVISGEEVHRVAATKGKRQREVRRASYIDAEHEGFWYPAYAAGDSFKAGDLLGEVRNIWGDLLIRYHAEYDGIVLYQTVGMGIGIGDPLIAYGMPEE